MADAAVAAVDEDSGNPSSQERNEKLNQCIDIAIEQFSVPRLEATRRNAEIALRFVKSLTEKLNDIDPRLLDCFGSSLGHDVPRERLRSEGSPNQFYYRLMLDIERDSSLFQVTTFARDINLPDMTATVKMKNVDAAKNASNDSKLSTWQEFLCDKGYLVPSSFTDMLQEAVDNTLMIYGDEFEMVSIHEKSPHVTLRIVNGENSVFVKIVPSVLCYGLPQGTRLPPKWPNHPHAKGRSKTFVKGIHSDVNSGQSLWVIEGQVYKSPPGIVKVPAEDLVPKLWSVSIDVLEDKFLDGVKKDDVEEEEVRKYRHHILQLFFALREGQEAILQGLTAKHLRTLLLWECNRHGDWSQDSAGERFLTMLQRLKDNLKLKTLQDFFYIDLNILCDLSASARRTMHIKVKHFLSAILREPESIFHFLPH
ncbi:protein mab-21-like 2 [Ptychodera flava]|uniref:protein mab-21-like 2 n=1 Tax=Ptychodera flava TaxID=63121 RepID=UPI00396A6292